MPEGTSGGTKINGSVTLPTWLLLALLVGGPSVGGVAGFKYKDSSASSVSKEAVQLSVQTALQTHNLSGPHPGAVKYPEFVNTKEKITETLEEIKIDLALIKKELGVD